jgi:hypothetical protein
MIKDMAYVKTEVPAEELRPNQIGQLEYQTMVTPLNETRQQLVGFTKPDFAYVLFEKKEWHLKEGGYKVPGVGLMTLNVEGRPEQTHQIDIYLKKGYRIIDYGNFPRLDDARPSRAAKARLYSQGAGINPWDELEKHIKNVGLNYDPSARQRLEESEKEVADLKARVAALSAKDEKKEDVGRRNTKADSRASAPQEHREPLRKSESES